MIICTLSIILFILTILWIGLVIALWKHEESDAGSAILAGLVIVGACGWGLLGNFLAVKSVDVPVEGRIFVTDTSLIVTVEGRPVITITDIATYKRLSDQTKIAIIRKDSVNIYNGPSVVASEYRIP